MSVPFPRWLLLAGAAVAGAAPAQELDTELLLAQAPIAVGDTFAFAAGELRQERVVKGAPYCADAVHETIQWLPDAAGGTPNRIVRQQSTRLCRDGEGRTRQEVDRGGRRLVYLRDPVAGESWVLDPAAKSARRLGRAALAEDNAAWREYGEKLREWTREIQQQKREGGAAATPPAPPAPPLPPLPALVDRSEREVRVLRIDPGPGAAPMLPPAVAWRAGELAPRGAGTASPLGSKDIEGVRASGERTTWTIEAGRVGNEKPIVIVREVWTAPDLMLTVSSRDFDPRSAETLYRLQNLKRGEPDAALMRVPADYSQRAPRAASGPRG